MKCNPTFDVVVDLDIVQCKNVKTFVPEMPCPGRARPVGGARFRASATYIRPQPQPSPAPALTHEHDSGLSHVSRTAGAPQLPTKPTEDAEGSDSVSSEHRGAAAGALAIARTRSSLCLARLACMCMRMRI